MRLGALSPMNDRISAISEYIIQARNKNSEKKFRAKSKATRRTEIAVLVLHQNRCESLSARDGTEAVPVDSIQNSIPSSVVVVATTEKISHVDILFGLFLLCYKRKETRPLAISYQKRHLEGRIANTY